MKQNQSNLTDSQIMAKAFHSFTPKQLNKLVEKALTDDKYRKRCDKRCPLLQV